jgi:phosphoglucomutase/phosphomannomutase
MATLRVKPPVALGGLDVVRTRDQASLSTWTPGSPRVAYGGVRSDLVIFDLTGLPGAGALLGDGRFPPLSNAVAARPSGTEPKIKFYLFTAAAPGAPDELAATKRALTARLDALERDLRALVGV